MSPTPEQALDDILWRVTLPTPGPLLDAYVANVAAVKAAISIKDKSPSKSIPPEYRERIEEALKAAKQSTHPVALTYAMDVGFLLRDTEELRAELAEAYESLGSLSLGASPRCPSETVHHCPDGLGRHTCGQSEGTFTDERDLGSITCLRCLRLLASLPPPSAAAVHYYADRAGEAACDPLDRSGTHSDDVDDVTCIKCLRVLAAQPKAHSPSEQECIDAFRKGRSQPLSDVIADMKSQLPSG